MTIGRDPSDHFPTLEVPNGGLILGSGGLPFPLLLVPQGWHAERNRTRTDALVGAGFAEVISWRECAHCNEVPQDDTGLH